MGEGEEGGFRTLTPPTPPPTWFHVFDRTSVSVSIRSSKAHPGPVVHISDNPMDEGKVSLHESAQKSTPPPPPQQNDNFLCLVTLKSLKWDHPVV